MRKISRLATFLTCQFETFAKFFQYVVNVYLPSFPRRQESMFEFNKCLNKNNLRLIQLDSRLRGNDVIGSFRWLQGILQRYQSVVSLKNHFTRHRRHALKALYYVNSNLAE